MLLEGYDVCVPLPPNSFNMCMSLKRKARDDLFLALYTILMTNVQHSEGDGQEEFE